MLVSEKIRAEIQRRVDGGETVYVIMKATGVAHGVISRFMRGEREIRSSTLDALAAYLGLELVESPAAGGKPTAPTAGKPTAEKTAKKAAKPQPAPSATAPTKIRSPVAGRPDKAAKRGGKAKR